MKKVWNINKYDENELIKIQETYAVSEIMAKFLLARQVEFEDVDNFLHPSLKKLRDPFEIKDMDKFVDRVLRAISDNEKICIYGDYDVDGITSICIMIKFLKSINADVIYYLPDRLVEGYGVNESAISYIHSLGTKLIITVDCGITAVSEIDYAKSLGIDVCVTDHHECPEDLPKAYAIVNPKQKGDMSKFKLHAGVGVAFKCICAISTTIGLDENEYMQYLDLVAVGTISDIVALVDENRIISKSGLELMQNTNNVGLKALLDVVPFKKIDSVAVSFLLAPRINACGRMGVAKKAVLLLLEDNYDIAVGLANELNLLNTKRQEIEKLIFDEAIKIIDAQREETKNSIVIYGEKWHNGVIGIVASRLVNLYHRPVILLTNENGIIRGSGRCPKGCNLYNMLTTCKEYLVQFGGHELAVGMSIEEDNISIFKEAFESAVKEDSKSLAKQIIDIDMEITKADLNIGLLRDIWTLKPYGQSNSVPLFVYKNIRISSIRTLSDDKHLKLVLKDEKSLIDAIAFSKGNLRDEYKIGDKIDVVCQVDLNVYNGKKQIQLIIEDINKSR